MTFPEPKGLSEMARNIYESRCRAVSMLSCRHHYTGFTRGETYFSVGWTPEGIPVSHKPAYADIAAYTRLGVFPDAETAMRAIYAYGDAR